jgi:hypothetical protein
MVRTTLRMVESVLLIEAGVRPGEELRSPEDVLAIGERYGLVILDVVPKPRR